MLPATSAISDPADRFHADVIDLAPADRILIAPAVPAPRTEDLGLGRPLALGLSRWDAASMRASTAELTKPSHEVALHAQLRRVAHPDAGLRWASTATVRPARRGRAPRPRRRSRGQVRECRRAVLQRTPREKARLGNEDRQ